MQLRDLERIAKQYYDNNKSAHDWSHIQRVLSKALSIAEKENDVDRDALVAMVYLHDVVRYEDQREISSIDQSCDFARATLSELGCDDSFIEKVIHGIKSHTLHGKHRVEPESIEAKILFDADKLDGQGYVGVARWLTMGYRPRGEAARVFRLLRRRRSSS